MARKWPCFTGLKVTRTTLCALSTNDHYSRANVIGRGIVGSLNAEVVIGSPLYKQHLRLRDDGLEYLEQQLRVWPVRWVDDEVQIAVSHRYKGRAGGYCPRFQLR